MMKIKLPLLARVLIAIVLGVVLSLFLPLGVVRVFETINTIFGNYLGFVIPLIILGLVASSIAEMGNRAGRMLLATVLIAYGSTVFSGFLSYGAMTSVYPSLLGSAAATTVDVVDKISVTPYFSIDMPPVMGVTAALVLAFLLGLIVSGLKGGKSNLIVLLSEFKDVVMTLITKSIIPLLPLYIFGIFLKLGAEGEVVSVLGVFMKVVVAIFVLQLVLLLIQFIIAGAVAKRNPLKALIGMLPAYLTALGTQSSAATIPVTLMAVKRNKVDDAVAEFVIPLCATVHIAGSMLKIVSCALAIAWTTGMTIDINIYTGFILMLGITMVAAPGVPGGAIMSALALLSSHLGFDETQMGLMIALYISMDSFGTAANVTGDGAIAIVINRFFGVKK